MMDLRLPGILALIVGLAGCAYDYPTPTQSFLATDFAQGLTAEDFELMYAARHSSLEENKAGEGENWANPASGNLGTITPLRTYKTDYGEDCREFQQSSTIDGVTEFLFDVACRNPEGEWYVVPSGHEARRSATYVDNRRYRRGDYYYPYGYPYYGYPYGHVRYAFGYGHGFHGFHGGHHGFGLSYGHGLYY